MCIRDSINVGITTGNNGYFSITEETSEQYQLSEVTLPLIGRSSHAHGIYFTAQDWEKNKIAGKRARLISFPEIPYDEYPAKHKEYISLGEANGEHEGYKCSIRERWYLSLIHIDVYKRQLSGLCTFLASSTI